MTIQAQGEPTARPQALLFTPGPRLGWTFRDRHSLISPYPEPPPDPEEIRAQAGSRLAEAQQSWQRARKWAARPSLIVAIALMALAGCAHAVNPDAPFGTTFLAALLLAGPGLSWSAWSTRSSLRPGPLIPGSSFRPIRSNGRSVPLIMSKPSWPACSTYRSGAARRLRRVARTCSAATLRDGGRC